MLRDPIYWKILKKIINLVDLALNIMPSYATNELYFPGIQVSNIVTKKMVTSFDLYNFDVTNALKSNLTKSDYEVKISQPRLANKPFTLKINVTSLHTQKGLIKIYLAPKTVPSNLSTVKDNLFLLDSFEHTFKVGSNLITRTTDEINNISKDLLSIKTLYNNIEDAEYGFDTALVNVESYAKFPTRILLPKGSLSGMTYQILVFIAPFIKRSKDDKYFNEFNTATLSPNYPLDLLDDINMLYKMPNTIFKEIVITHKGDKIASNYKNKDEQWNKNNYDPASRSIFDYNAKRNSETYDYKTKKEQYSKKMDVSESELIPRTDTNIDNGIKINELHNENQVENNEMEDVIYKNKNFTKPISTNTNQDSDVHVSMI